MGGDGSGPTRESGLDKVWTMVRNGGDAYEAWQACGEPTTWGNARRFLRNARAEAPSSGAVAPATSQLQPHAVAQKKLKRPHAYSSGNFSDDDDFA